MSKDQSSSSSSSSASSSSSRASSIGMLNDNFFCCEICFESFSLDNRSRKVPKTAKNCLHTFCMECIDQSITPDSTHFECFVCRTPTPIDKALGANTFKTNFMLQNLIATLLPLTTATATAASAASADTADTPANNNNASSSSSLPSPSASVNVNSVFQFTTTSSSGGGGAGGGDDVCDHCPEDEASKATLICTQCEVHVLYCDNCSVIHKRSKVGRGHEFVPVGSVQKKKSELTSCFKTSSLLSFL